MRTIAFWLSLIMIFMIPSEGILDASGLGKANQLMGLVVGAFWLFTIIFSRKIRKIAPFHIFVILFFLWNAISIFWSLDVDHTWARVLTHIRMAGLVLVIWDIFDTPLAVRIGLQVYVLGTIIPVANIINNYIVGDLFGFSRYAITGSGPNSSGIIAALAIPIALHLAASANSSKLTRALRLVNYAYVPAAIFAIILTATRFAMLMTVPALLFGLATLTQLKLASRSLIFMLLIGVLLFLPSIIPETSLQRLGSTGAELSTGDLNGRTTFWEDGIDMWIEQPIVGIGSDAFPKAAAPLYGRPRSIHSSFFAVLVETGVIGFVLFGTILASAVYQIRYLPRWEARFWTTMLVVWGLANLVMTWGHTKTTWLILSLLVVSAANVSRQRATLSPHIHTTTIPQTPSLATQPSKTELRSSSSGW